jgi:hypothetical protein
MGDESIPVVTQLEKLEALRASGVLSDSEFQNLKSGLMGKDPAKGSSVSAKLVGVVLAIVAVAVVLLFALPRHRETMPIQIVPKAASIKPANPADAANLSPGAGPLEASPAEAPPLFATSFDCTQARRLALRIICSNENLAAQDMQLASLYRRARANAIDSSQLFDQQQEWLAARDSCASIACLSMVYGRRRAELARWITN